TLPMMATRCGFPAGCPPAVAAVEPAAARRVRRANRINHDRGTIFSLQFEGGRGQRGEWESSSLATPATSLIYSGGSKREGLPPAVATRRATVRDRTDGSPVTPCISRDSPGSVR